MNKTNLEFWESFLNNSIPLLQLLILIIPFLGVRPLFDLQRSFWKKFSKRGYAILALGFILYLATLKQTKVTKNINNLNQKTIDSITDIKDKSRTKHEDSIDLKTKEMLAKYGFKVDSTNEEIVKILKDPNLRKTTVVNGESPLLDISNIQIDKNDDSLFTFTFTSYDASSFDVNVKLDVLSRQNGRILLIKKDIPIFQNTIIKKEQGLENFRRISNTSAYSLLLFRLHGSIKKEDGKTIKINSFSGYDKAEKERKFGYPTINIVNELKNFYSKNELN